MMPDTGKSHPNAGQLWAITAYFNPVGYQRRRDNYQYFRRQLQVPLVTVELSHRDFDLRRDDADILVQVRGPDVMWQKERLLNLAMQQLPSECAQVVWLDCDVLFDSENWANEVRQLLDEYAVVQLFRELIHLGPGALRPTGQVSPLACRASAAYRWCTQTLPADAFVRPEASMQYRCNSGMAWAARRALLDEHGLYDALILGMGDKAIAAAALGLHADVIEAFRMNGAQARHYLQWAVPFCASVGGKLGWRDGRILHLWHGNLEDRHYPDRYDGFEAFSFDPAHDLRLSADGCWCWNSTKPDLHQHVADYFWKRREDGRDVHAPAA
jgi:hypothetical protein